MRRKRGNREILRNLVGWRWLSARAHEAGMKRFEIRTAAAMAMMPVKPLGRFSCYR